MISKSAKEYANEEDLRDNEGPNYEELCMLEVAFYNEHDNSWMQLKIIGDIRSKVCELVTILAAEFWINRSNCFSGMPTKRELQ